MGTLKRGGVFMPVFWRVKQMNWTLCAADDELRESQLSTMLEF